MLYLYNYLTRKKETFKPLKRGPVGLYTCGPTVYNFAHIGNLRTYVFEDVLRRTLEYSGYKVRHVMNITDVGHLTSDADTGEDRLEKGAKREGKSVWDIARFFTNEFKTDIKKLNILPAHVLTPATANIKEQIKIIQTLIKKGYAYETPTAVYFNVPKFKQYSHYSRQPLENILVGARHEVVVDQEKKHPADFVLWFKLVGHFKNHTMRWPSPWGTGFPGWHIECSAISTKYLGQPFDIHTGGVDHIFPHHTNEIAQSQAAIGKPLARFWLEGEFLQVDGGKMSKSLENFYTLADIKKKGFSPLAFRYLALTAHYRSKINFTWESLRAASEALEHLYDFVRELKSTPHTAKKKIGSNAIATFKSNFDKSISDDLDTPKALAVIWKLIREYNKNQKSFDPKSVLKLLLAFDEVLGLGLKTVKAESAPPEVTKLLKERETLRKASDWSGADKIRNKLVNLGWQIKDTPSGPQFTKTL